MVLERSGTIVMSVMAAISAVGTLLPDPEPVNGGDVRIGRYETIAPQRRPDQQDLSSALVDLELSDNVKTVGKAIAAVLENSGYRLSPSRSAPCQEKWFELPLPAVHRELGPLLSLRQALAVLSGPAYRPALDPLRRLVYFERVLPDEPTETPDCDCD